MKKTMFLGLIFVALMIVGAIGFRVRTIQCSMGEAACSAEIESQLSTLQGTSLFFTNFETSIPQNIPDETVRYISHQKELPGTLQIKLQQEEPLYALQEGDTFFTVYASGVLQPMQQIEDSEYHVIELQFPIETISSEGTIDPQKHQTLAEYSLSLYKNQFDLQNSTWIDSKTIQIDLPSGIRVLLPFDEAPQKVAALEAIVASTEIETITEPITEIDLRYKYPVLRTTE